MQRSGYTFSASSSNCVMFNDSFELSKEIFAPFDSVFEDFQNSEYNFDILIQEIGQNSQLIRFYQDGPGLFVLTKYHKGISYMKKLDDFELLDVELPKKNSAYFCNDGVSDLSTNIYAIKLYGETSFKLWFENGDYDDLSKTEAERLSDVISIFSNIKNESSSLK